MANDNKRIRKLINREGTIFTNTFDIGRDLINEAFALQEKGDNINYEHPMGHKVVIGDRAPGIVEILSGDAIDVEVKNTLETFDAKKNKLLLESKNIVRDYNDFVQCHFEKNIAGRSGENGTPSYAKYFKYFNDDVNSAINDGISDSALRAYIADEYHQTDDPEIIRKIVQMRIKYIEGVNAILKEMLKTNGQLLGLNEQQIDALIKGLSNDETSGKTVGEIKDIIVANKEKFIKQNGTILDLRPLGAGVYIGAGDDDDHKVDEDDDKLKTVIQRCLTYDLILNAHGGAYSGKGDLVITDRDHAINVCAEKIIKILPRHGTLGKLMLENPKCKYYIEKLSSRLIINGDMHIDTIRFNDESREYIELNIMNLFNLLSSKELYDKIEKDLDALIKDIYLIYKGLVKNNNGSTYFSGWDTYDRKEKCKMHSWYFSIRYLDGKEYNSVKEVIKMAKSKGFDKILIYSCNPGSKDLPKDLIKNVTFAKHSVWKETFIDDNYIDYYNESTAEYNIYGFLNDFENDYRAIAESYNIDYDNDQILNEMYNYVISGQYLAETTTIHEGKLADIWHKIIEFIKKAIGFIIKLVKMFIGWIKGIIDKIKERFSKKKKVKINKSKIKASFISVEGDNASLTSEKEVSSYDELKEMINIVMGKITKIFRKNSDEQVRLQNSLKNECERAANKQSSIGEGYLGLYESTRVKSLINKNSNTIQQITSIIIPISNKAVNKRFNNVGNASVSNTMKKYSKSTNGMLNSNFSDINTIKAEYSLPKDKEVFSKMGKEYQWNEDFSNELDKLTESIKRMPKIKEICSNVTWETHPNKFCICFHIKKQLLDYSSND